MVPALTTAPSSRGRRAAAARNPAGIAALVLVLFGPAGPAGLAGLARGQTPTSTGIPVTPAARLAEVVIPSPDSLAADLDSLVAAAGDSVVLRFSPGVYRLGSRPYVEETCGNCEAETTRVEATVGLRIAGTAVELRGSPDGETILDTGAGYGVLFEDCAGCALEGVTVTGGVRDTAAMASDAAVLVKGGAVEIADCLIRDNVGDSSVVARIVSGIMGICGRDGARLTITGNRILRNSWDGIALYRNTQAVIEGNVVDGADLARGSEIGGGRGVGIGLTWNAFSTVRGNLIRNYWKGIGVFVDAQATIEENVIENVATWGLALWDAGSGRPGGFFRRNVVYKTGACGIMISRTSVERPPPGQLILNAFVHTGQDPRYDSGEPYCLQEAIARHGVPESFTVSANLLFRNREATGRAGKEDLDRKSFEARLRPLWDALDRWGPPKESTFWRDYHEAAAEGNE